MRAWLARVPRFALTVVSFGFAAIGVAMAAQPHGPADRLAGVTGAVFFGTAGWLLANKDRRGRGLPADPSPTLRVGSGPARPDRLAFGPGRERLAYSIAGVLFFGAAATSGFGLIGGIEGTALGGLSIVLVLVSLIPIALSFSGPCIVFERDHVAYRFVPRGWRRVPYADLASGDVVTTIAGGYCVLRLAHLERFLASQPEGVRREFASNTRHFGAEIVLPNGVDPNAEQLLDLIKRYATWDGEAAAISGEAAPAIARSLQGARE